MRKESSTSELIKILEKIPENELLTFLVNYAENSEHFANAVFVHFGELNIPRELKKISDNIETITRGIKARRKMDSHDWWSYSTQINDITQEIEQRCRQGHIALSFSQSSIVYRELMKVYELQEECEISMEIDSILLMMARIADKAVGEDKDFIIKRSRELALARESTAYTSEYQEKLLAIANKSLEEDKKN